MKLLIAADIFPPQSGGPATYVVNLANALTKDGWEVTIVSHNPDGDVHVTRNTYHVTSRNKVLRYLQYFRLLKKHGKDVDVIYAMGPVNAGLPALLVAKLLKKKLVVKIVGDYAWEQWQQNAKLKMQNAKFVSVDEFQDMNIGGKIGLLKKVERFVVRRADTVIVPSGYLKKIVRGWGAREDHIEVIQNAVEFIVGTPKPHEGEKWVVSVGRLMPWKGMDTLIDIAQDFVREFPEDHWKLKIVGDGPEKKILESRITDYGLEDVVELTGRLSKKDTHDYLASADVFVLNSGYEGFPHIVVEAHNQGVPVLVSRMGGNEDVAKGPALFEYNNREEIKEKILAFSKIAKREPMRHGFLEDMIRKTKKILESVCES